MKGLQTSLLLRGGGWFRGDNSQLKACAIQLARYSFGDLAGTDAGCQGSSSLARQRRKVADQSRIADMITLFFTRHVVNK